MTYQLDNTKRQVCSLVRVSCESNQLVSNKSKNVPEGASTCFSLFIRFLFATVPKVLIQVFAYGTDLWSVQPISKAILLFKTTLARNSRDFCCAVNGLSGRFSDSCQS